MLSTIFRGPRSSGPAHGQSKHITNVLKLCSEGQNCGKCWSGMLEEGQRVRTLSCRGEDLASALMLCPHCRNQVSSISESGSAEVRESRGAEEQKHGKVEKWRMC